MNLLIVDRDTVFAEHLSNYFFVHHKIIENIEIASNDTDIIDVLQEVLPNFLILNSNIGLEMVHEVLECIQINNIPFVMISDDSNFALDALKYRAIEFILLPVMALELFFLLNRALLDPQLNFSTEEGNQRVLNSNAILIWDKDRMYPYDLTDIVKIKSRGAYSCFYLKDDKIIVSAKNLGVYEDMLKGTRFIRIHRSCIINPECIKFYNPGINAFVTLSDSKIEYVSKRRKKELLKYFNLT